MGSDPTADPGLSESDPVILRRIPTWAWLATIVVVSVVFRGVIVRGILAPFIVVDEILWSEVARGLADSGQPLVATRPIRGSGSSTRSSSRRRIGLSTASSTHTPP